MKERLVWAEINLKKLHKNYKSIKKFLDKKVRVMIVVKANAYGHGLVRIAQEAEKKLGADYLGIVCVQEGRVLRQAGITLPILILSFTDKYSVKYALDYNLTITVMDKVVLQEIEKEAKKRKIQAKVHVNIDTGMHFHGILPKDAIKLIKKIQHCKHVVLEGVFSHFATADEKDLSFAQNQLDTFISTIETLKKIGINPPLIHMANSAGIVMLPTSHFTMVRLGTFLYGPQTGKQLPTFTPETTLSLKTIVAQVRDIPKGESVGYNRAFMAKKKTRVASIAVGYADGFRRSPNWEYVLIHGKKAPIIGKISMDSTAVNVTHIKRVKVGDEVILLGKQGKKEITIGEIAKKLRAANFEIIGSLTERVSRLYTY